MADLMQDTYTYDDLANQYGNFCVPAAKMKVEGTEVATSLIQNIEEISVKLSLNIASSVTIKILGGYDLKSRNFDSDLKDSFTLGKTIEVELGYLSSTLKIFKGFIASVTMEFTEEPQLVIIGMDARRLMMQPYFKEKYYVTANYTDIVSDIMGQYSSLCSVELEATQDNLEKAIYQRENDFDFIMNQLTKLTNREFFILGDKAYFREPKKQKSAIITLENGLNLISFKRQSNYIDYKIIANGYDRKEQKAIRVEETVKNTDTQTTIISETPTWVAIEIDADTETNVTTRAKSMARSLIDMEQKGMGKSVGIPEIVPGRFIKIDKLDSDANHKYYITEVTHNFTQEGFTTEFEIGGW